MEEEKRITFNKKEWDEYNEKMIKIAQEAYEKGVLDTKETWGWKMAKKQIWN
jgi:hypothetical protein